MTITKYEHVCFVVEHKGKKLVIDPGIFSKSLGKPKDVAAVILTHQHADHVDTAKVKELLTANPDAGLYGTRDTAAEYLDLPVTIMHAGETLSRDGFEIDFFGGKHEIIHPDTPQIENLGVLINDKVFYPGDSFVHPDIDTTEVLLVPLAAPWMKVKQAMKFVSEVSAERFVPTHDAILSDEGKQVYDKWLDAACEHAGKHYERMQTGETLKLKS